MLFWVWHVSLNVLFSRAVFHSTCQATITVGVISNTPNWAPEACLYWLLYLLDMTPFIFKYFLTLTYFRLPSL